MLHTATPPRRIVILRRDGEFRVPSPKGPRHEPSAYYTTNRDDAIGTARAMHGVADLQITFRSVREFPC